MSNNYRIRDIRKEILDIRTKLGISTKEPPLSKEISSKNKIDAAENKTDASPSWFGASSNFSGRKLKQFSGDEKQEEHISNTNTLENYFNENLDGDNGITGQSKRRLAL